MSLERIHSLEREKWNVLAEKKLSAVRALSPGDNFFKYTQRTSTMAGIDGFLSDLDGKRVLEYGCGVGIISSLLAKSGAIVTSFDLSKTSVRVTHRRADINNVADRIHLTVAAGEFLPFDDESYDVIFGKAILHHLDASLGWSHLYRVLKTGGKAVFVEPLGMNPILTFARDHLPYPNKNPRGADRPLTYEIIGEWGRGFKSFFFEEIQLLSMLERGLGFNKRLENLRRIDRWLLKRIPKLRRYCRYVVMYMEK